MMLYWYGRKDDRVHVFVIFYGYTTGFQGVFAGTCTLCRFPADVHPALWAVSDNSRTGQEVLGVFSLWLLVGHGFQCVCFFIATGVRYVAWLVFSCVVCVW